MSCCLVGHDCKVCPTKAGICNCEKIKLELQDLSSDFVFEVNCRRPCAVNMNDLPWLLIMKCGSQRDLAIVPLSGDLVALTLVEFFTNSLQSC